MSTTNFGPPALTENTSFASIQQSFNQALQRLISELPKVSSRARVDDLPEIYIDLLAAELQVPGYRQNLGIDRKRMLVKQALQLNAQLGTPYAIKQLLTIAFNHSKIIEWFQEENPKQAIPYTFRILTTDQQVDPEKVQQMAILIERSKNVRSQCREILRIQSAETDTYVANAQSITKRTLTTTTINN